MSTPSALVQKLWNYCNILRDGGLSYGNDLESMVTTNLQRAFTGTLLTADT